MKTIKKIIAVFFGVIFVFVSAELILRGIGTIYHLQHGVDVDETVFKRTGDKVILFLGNSFTLGSGAPPGFGYPDHLRKMLDQKYGKGKYQIVNKGRGNVNTRYILENLKKNLDEVEPDLVVMMAGQPNRWNYYGYGDYVQEIDGKEETLWQKAYSLLDRSKVYKFFALLDKHRSDEDFQIYKHDEKRPMMSGLFWIAGLQTGNQYVVQRMTRKEGEEAEKALKILTQYPDHSRAAYYFLGLISHHVLHHPENTAYYFKKALEAAGDNFDYTTYQDLYHYPDDGFWSKIDPALYAELKKNALKYYPGDKIFSQLDTYFQTTYKPKENLEEFFKLAIKTHPTFGKSYRELAEIYLSEQKAFGAAEVIKQGIWANPFSVQFDLFSRLEYIKFNFSHAKLTEKIDEFIKKFSETYPTEAHRTAIRNKEDLKRWIYFDNSKIIKQVRARNIPIVLQTYPPERVHPEMVVNQTILEISKDLNVPLSNTYKFFKEEVFTKYEREKFYSNQFGPDDSHLNATGYYVLAKLLYADLVKFGLLPQTLSNQ